MGGCNDTHVINEVIMVFRDNLKPYIEHANFSQETNSLGLLQMLSALSIFRLYLFLSTVKSLLQPLAFAASQRQKMITVVLEICV